MGATLDALCRLQEVELQIAELQRGIERKRRVVRRHEKRIADLDRDIEARRKAIQSDQAEADAVDLDVKSREAEIAKLRQALNTTKTNKEYSAVLTQLNTNKADNSKLEDRCLGMFNRIDEKKQQLAAIRADRDAESERLEGAKASVRAIEEKSRDKLTRLFEEREVAGSAVPASTLDMFNRVANKHDGEAMAMVIRTHPKRAEYACEGCNMSIRIEQINSLLSRDEAVLCNSCGRILFYESPAESRAS
ncbi:MAG: C4-type zinc ribbon domain-containing protein [Planctomycetota bacterium]